MVISKKAFYVISLIFIAAFLGAILDSEIICRAGVFFILIICLYNGYKEHTLVNPYFLFSLTPISLLIYVNLSDRYMVDLTTSTWILAIINMAAFLIAFEFTGDYKSIKNCIGTGTGKMLTQHTFILLALGFLPILYKLATGQLMPLASVFSLFSTPAIVCAMKSKNKQLIFFTVLLFTFSWAIYVNKSTILFFALAIFISYEKYYIISKKQKAKLITFFIIGLIFMILSFSFANQNRGTMGAVDAVAYYAKSGGINWDYADILFMPYMYLTTPWANLQYVMETQAFLTYGLWMIKPFLGYFQIDGLFENLYKIDAYSTFNTFTYIVCGLKDFGYWGSMISSIFLGFFAKKVYSRYKISRSPLDVACYVLLGQAVLEMFFSNEFYMMSFPFTIVIIMGLYKMIFCKKNQVELEKI